MNREHENDDVIELGAASSENEGSNHRSDDSQGGLMPWAGAQRRVTATARAGAMQARASHRLETCSCRGGFGRIYTGATAAAAPYFST